MNTREKIQSCWSIEKMFWNKEYDHFHWLFHNHKMPLIQLEHYIESKIFHIMDGYEKF